MSRYLGGSFDPPSFFAAATFIGFLAAGHAQPGRVFLTAWQFFFAQVDVVFFCYWPMLKNKGGGFRCK